MTNLDLGELERIVKRKCLNKIRDIYRIEQGGDVLRSLASEKVIFNALGQVWDLTFFNQKSKGKANKFTEQAFLTMFSKKKSLLD